MLDHEIAPKLIQVNRLYARTSLAVIEYDFIHGIGFMTQRL